jgi:hypothetical protein
MPDAEQYQPDEQQRAHVEQGQVDRVRSAQELPVRQHPRLRAGRSPKTNTISVTTSPTLAA